MRVISTEHTLNVYSTKLHKLINDVLDLSAFFAPLLRSCMIVASTPLMDGGATSRVHKPRRRCIFLFGVFRYRCIIIFIII